MNFKQAFEQMKQGNNVKCPNWSCYWTWENETIMMHCEDGTVMNLLDVENPECTFEVMASDDFILADKDNTSALGGKAHMSFGDAFKLVKKGMGMRLQFWKEDVVIRVQYPDEYSKMTAPYLYVESRFGRVPWKETVIELFSDEWEVIE